MSVALHTRRILAALVSTLLVVSGLVLLAPARAEAHVPDRPSNHSLVVVKAGGIRVGTVVQPLEGVVLELRRVTGALIDTCTSDTDGDCVFTVHNDDISPGNNNDFWVVPAAVPFAAGSPAAEHYFTNSEFVIGSSNFDPEDYRFLVENLGDSEIEYVDDAESATSGMWQNSYENPPALQQCGLDIALVSDLSYSIAQSNALDDLKEAATGFVEALAGTPSTVSLYTFATSAPAPGAPDVLGKSTLDPDDIDDLLEAIDGYDIPGIQYTNWDAAFRQLFGTDYDQVVIITDGNPTRSDVPAVGSGGNTRFIELEHAVFSANAVKAAGSRVVAVGVGDDFEDGQNLRAISGAVEGDDYFITGWDDVAQQLEQLALGHCQGTVTVVKQVVPWNWDGQSDGTPTGGWTFDASVDEGTVAPAQAITSNDNGAVNFSLEVPQEGADLTVVEQLQDGYTFAGASCTVQGEGSRSVASVSNGFRVEVGPKDIVTCTVTNKAPRPHGAIEVEKRWIVNGAAPTAEFPSGFAATATVDGAEVAWDATTSTPAGTVQVGETDVSVPAQYCDVESQQVTSVNGAAITPVDVSNGTYAATVAAGETTMVTITNTVDCVGILYLLKKVEGGPAAPSSWTLVADPDSGPTIQGATGVSGAAQPGVTYALSESGGVAGYELDRIACSTSPTGPFTGDVTSVTVEARTTVYCQFVNVAIAPQLRLVKQVAGADVDADNWTLSATAAGQPTVSGDGVVDYTEVAAGVEYQLSEAAVDGFDGSEFDASDWTCTVTDGPGAGTETTGDDVTLSYGQQVECVITNTVRGATPTFDKDAGTATSNGDGTWDITYELTATNPSKFVAIEYDLVDEPDLPTGVVPVSALVEHGATTVLDIADWDGGDLAIAEDATLAADSTVTYDVTITVRIPSSVPAASLECDVNGNGFDNSATLTPTGGTPISDEACVSVTPPTVAHDKVVTGVEQQQDGTWEITYTVTVTATGAGAALYDLSDVPTFGDDITIESATATADPAGQSFVGTWNGTSQTVLADERVIAGGAQHEYEIVIVATVDVDATEADTDCTVGDAEDGTGFLNTATLVAGGVETDAADCASPAAPELEKQAISVTQNADASWEVVYRVDVVNPSADASLVYSLADVPGFPAGVTIDDVAVSKDGAAHTWADRTQPVATGQVLEPSGVDSYVFTFTITVDAGISDEVLECSAEGAGYGLFNEAIVTSGGLDPITSDDCLPLEDAVVPNLTKVVAPGFPTQLANGDWSIRYTITVSTPAEAEQATRYDLEDALDFGEGITVLTSSATGPDGAIAGWTGAAPDVTLATDVLLPAGESHVYTVDVTASVAAGVTGTAAADCEAGDGEEGTGFLNTAELTVGSVTRSADDCASPSSPELAKSLVGTPVKDDVTGNVTVTYDITVRNPSDLALSYDLDDQLGFAFGVLIQDVEVTTTEAGITPSATWTGIAPDTSIVTGVAIAAGDEHVYRVTVVAKPSLLVEEQDQACEPGTPGKGYFNLAVLTSGDEVLTDDACAPIPDADLPTLPLPPEEPELPTLPLTGAAAIGPMLLALSLLGAGLVLVLIVVRRRLNA